MHPQRCVTLNPDRPAQTVNRESLDEIVGRCRFAVEQQIIAIIPDYEVEQALALRREKPRPSRQLRVDIAGDKSLQESAHVLAGEPYDGAIGEGGSGHGSQLGSDEWHRKR